MEHQNKPNFLDSCQGLTRGDDCEAVFFNQILELVEASLDNGFQAITHPAQVDDILSGIADNIIDVVAKAQAARNAAQTRNTAGHEAKAARLAQHLRQQQRTKGQARIKSKTPELAMSNAQVCQVLGQEQPDPPVKFPVALRRANPATRAILAGAALDQLQLLYDLRDVLEMDPSALPSLAIGLRYRQEWCSMGYNRGDLIRSIPLAADARKEISVKTWRVRNDRREENESIEENISNEYVGDEKWSLAVQKQTSVELNQQLDARLKANGDVTIPVKKVPVKVGAEGGGESQTDVNIKRTVTETEEGIKQTTVKAASSLKNTVSSTVETSEERGFESTVNDVLVNPNKCHTLTYHFFEIIETFKVQTTLDRADSYIMLPFPYPQVTKEWLLCHECLLQRVLPCTTYYAGFDAAKLILSNERLGLFTATGDAGNSQTDGLMQLIETIVSAYDALRMAGLLPVTGGGEDDDEDDGTGVTVEGVVDGIVDTGNNIVETVGGWIEDGGNAVKEGASQVVGWLGDVNPLYQTAAAPTQPVPLAFSTALRSTAPGGTGSFIYHEIAKLAAPELLAALSGLSAAHQSIESMPDGPAKSQALLAALETFFAAIGDVEDTFRKIDTGLVIALISVVGAASISAGLLTVLTAPLVIGVSTPALVLSTALGLAAGMGVAGAGFSTALAGYGLEQMAQVDLHPDDRGLKNSIHGLYALYRQLGHAVGVPVLPTDPTPEQVAAHERMLREQQQQRRTLAEAQVELERLTCHIEKNLAHYFQFILAQMPAAEIERALVDRFSIPAHVVDLQFVGFHGNRAALRVRDLDWLAAAGIDVEAAIKAVVDAASKTENDPPDEIVLPTRGMTVEPQLGDCDGCDDFIKSHRALDLAQAETKLDQARLEAKRLEARLNANLLGDPTPFEGAGDVSVSVSDPASNV